MTTPTPAQKPQPWSATATLPRDALAALLRPQARMAEVVLAQNLQVLDFYRTRFEKDRALMAEMAQESDPHALLFAWTGFWQGMVVDYAAEMGKLASSMAAVADQAVRSATDEGKALGTVLKPAA